MLLIMNKSLMIYAAVTFDWYDQDECGPGERSRYSDSLGLDGAGIESQ
jgi:hypothetical protein